MGGKCIISDTPYAAYNTYENCMQFSILLISHCCGRYIRFSKTGDVNLLIKFNFTMVIASLSLRIWYKLKFKSLFTARPMRSSLHQYPFLNLATVIIPEVKRCTK